MKDKQPPSDNEIMQCVKQILDCADLDKTTMKMLCTQVYSHYPDFDLMHKKDFIKSTVRLNLDLRPSVAQMDKLVQFLEDNPEIATGAHLRSAQGRIQTKLKWQELTATLNAMGGANRNADSWASMWSDKKQVLERIIAQRNAAATRSGYGVEHLQPLSESDERLVRVLGGPRYEEGVQELITRSDSSSPDHSMDTNGSEAEVHEVEVPTGSTPTHTVQTTQAASQTTQARPSSITGRRGPRVSGRPPYGPLAASQRLRILRLQQRRLRAEQLANSVGVGNLIQAIDRLTEAVEACGDKIAAAITARRQ